MKKFNNKISVSLLIALVGFPQISETIYTPALPNIASGLNASALMVEMTLAIYFLGFAVGVLLWGMFSDWCGRKYTMLIGLFLYGIGTFSCANVEDIESLLAWRFLQAFGASVGSVITQTILRDAYDGKELAKLFSIISGALAFSPAIGPVVGGIVTQFFGWRANFLILAILAIILFAWSCLMLPETRPVNRCRLSINDIYHLGIEMIKSRVLWGYVVLIAATNGILFGFYQEAPFIFIEQLGMKPSYYGLFGLLVAGATMLASRISYKQASKFSPEVIIRSGASCVLLGGIIFVFSVTIGIFNLKLIGIACITLTLFLIFFGIGLIIPNSLSQALKPYNKRAGTASSIFGACYYPLIAVCTGFMSLIHNETSLPLALYVTLLGIISVVGCKMIRSPLYRETKKDVMSC